MGLTRRGVLVGGGAAVISLVGIDRLGQAAPAPGRARASPRPAWRGPRVGRLPGPPGAATPGVTARGEPGRTTDGTMPLSSQSYAQLSGFPPGGVDVHLVARARE